MSERADKNSGNIINERNTFLKDIFTIFIQKGGNNLEILPNAITY